MAYRLTLCVRLEINVVVDHSFKEIVLLWGSKYSCDFEGVSGVELPC